MACSFAILNRLRSVIKCFEFFRHTVYKSTVSVKPLAAKIIYSWLVDDNQLLHSQNVFKDTKHDYRCTFSVKGHPLLVDTLRSTWIGRSLTGGLVVVTRRIGHYGHRTSLSRDYIYRVTWRTWCKNIVNAVHYTSVNYGPWRKLITCDQVSLVVWY